MTSSCDTDPRAGARMAIERLWTLGERLAMAWRDLRGTLPIILPSEPGNQAAPGEGGAGPLSYSLSELDQVYIDAFLFRLSATMTALVEDVMEPLLLLQGEVLFMEASENLQTLESVGALSSADRVSAIRERVRRHHRSPTLTGEARAEALNTAWADGRAMLDVLVGLSRHIQEMQLIPGLQPFDEGAA